MARFSYRSARRAGRRFRRKATRRPRRTLKTRRPYSRRSRMTKRKVLEIASTKKRTLMPLRVGNDLEITYATLTPGLTVALWCPTAMVSSGSFVTHSHTRSASSVFQVGVAENMVFDIDKGYQWRHRRVVFETKGLRLESAYGNGTGVDRYRKYNPLSETESRSLFDTIFEGSLDNDSTGFFDNKLDTSRIKVHYDKSRNLTPSNANGHIHKVKFYHPLKKNMTYDDDEDGDVKDSNKWSSLSREGLGDIYIVDIFQDVWASEDAHLYWKSQACHYWHEK